MYRNPETSTGWKIYHAVKLLLSALYSENSNSSIVSSDMVSVVLAIFSAIAHLQNHRITEL